MTASAETRGHDHPARHWTLDSEIAFLNHGSFGACPTPVLEVQSEYRARLEREPVHFYTRVVPGLLADARERLGRFIGADPTGLAFVANATTGVNAVLRSLPLAPGDELIVSDHEYNACRNVLDYVARERGATVVVAAIPFPIESAEAAVEAVLRCVTERTRLALLDHVTSQTALVLPIETMVRALAARGVDTLVDGAHAPGMLPLDIGAMAPAYYTGNCHKWLCAPKSAGFLWVREDLRPSVRPAVISHGANAPVPIASRYRVEFEWMGTSDPTAALAVPAALDFMANVLPGGWEAVRAHNRALVLAGGEILAAVLGRARACPEALVGSMLSLPVPPSTNFPARDAGVAAASALGPDPLHTALFREHAVEVPIIGCPAHPGRLLRISAQLYNTRTDYERLAGALAALL